MNLNEYQEKARKYDFFEQTNDLMTPGFIAKVLGLAGEAGEIADKFKKIIRDEDSKISPEAKIALKKELGDVLWYVATVSRYLEISLEDVAESNLSKLESRLERGALAGSGDDR